MNLSKSLSKKLISHNQKVSKAGSRHALNIIRPIITIILLVLFTLSSCNQDDSWAEPPAAITDPGINSELNLDVALILELVNQARSEPTLCGTVLKPSVPPLIWNDELAMAALHHSNDMQTNKYFSHRSLDGTSFLKRVYNAGYQGDAIGENIASGYRTEYDVVQGWLNSPGHCSTIMHPLAKEIGIARSAQGFMWTMVVGEP